MSQRILLTGAARDIGAGSARRLALEVDVTDGDALREAVEAAADGLRGLDVAIANAGIAGAGVFRTMDEDAWERVIAVNVKGVHRTIKASVPHLVASLGYALPVASVAAVGHAPVTVVKGVEGRHRWAGNAADWKARSTA